MADWEPVYETPEAPAVPTTPAATPTAPAADIASKAQSSAPEPSISWNTQAYGAGGQGMNEGFAANLGLLADDFQMIYGRPLRVTSGYRPDWRQAEIFYSGVRPAAPPGHSRHREGLAADVDPRDLADLMNMPLADYGFETLARIGDPTHLQYPGNYSPAEKERLAGSIGASAPAGKAGQATKWEPVYEDYEPVYEDEKLRPLERFAGNMERAFQEGEILPGGKRRGEMVKRGFWGAISGTTDKFLGNLVNVLGYAADSAGYGAAIAHGAEEEPWKQAPYAKGLAEQTMRKMKPDLPLPDAKQTLEGFQGMVQPGVDWLKDAAKKLAPTGPAAETFTDKVMEGIGSLPVALVKYGIPMSLMGPTFGMAFVDMIEASDTEDPMDVIKAGAKGAFMGKFLHVTGPMKMVPRVGSVATLFGGLSYLEGGDVNDVTASATLGAMLALMGGRGNKTAREAVGDTLKTFSEQYAKLRASDKAALWRKIWPTKLEAAEDLLYRYGTIGLPPDLVTETRPFEPRPGVPSTEELGISTKPEFVLDRDLEEIDRLMKDRGFVEEEEPKAPPPPPPAGPRIVSPAEERPRGPVEEKPYEFRVPSYERSIITPGEAGDASLYPKEGSILGVYGEADIEVPRPAPINNMYRWQGPATKMYDFAERNLPALEEFVLDTEAAMEDSQKFISSRYYDRNTPIPREGGIAAAKDTEKYQTDPFYKAKVDNIIDQMAGDIVDAYHKIDLLNDAVEHRYGGGPDTRKLLAKARRWLAGEEPLMAIREEVGPGGKVRATYGVNVTRAWNMEAKNKYGQWDLGDIAVRECVQNSLDAVIKALAAGEVRQGRIDITADYKSYTVDDNGIGMSDIDIRDKFLALHGTGKAKKGDFGGFGIAKAVILGPSDTARWILQTRDNYFTGEMASNFEEIRTTKKRQGTSIRVETDDVIIDKAQRFVETTEVPKNISISYNGDPVKYPFKGLRHKVEYAGPAGEGTEVTITYYPKAPDNYNKRLIARLVEPRTGAKLTQMFEPIYKQGFEGALVVDVKTAKTPETSGYPFTDSRNELRTEASSKIQAIVDKYGTDTQSAKRAGIEVKRETPEQIAKSKKEFAVSRDLVATDETVQNVSQVGRDFGVDITPVTDMDLRYDTESEVPNITPEQAKLSSAMEATLRLKARMLNIPVGKFYLRACGVVDGGVVAAEWATGDFGYNYTSAGPECYVNPVDAYLYLTELVDHELTHHYVGPHNEQFTTEHGRIIRHGSEELMNQILSLAEAVTGREAKEVRRAIGTMPEFASMLPGEQRKLFAEQQGGFDYGKRPELFEPSGPERPSPQRPLPGTEATRTISESAGKEALSTPRHPGEFEVRDRHEGLGSGGVSTGRTDAERTVGKLRNIVKPEKFYGGGGPDTVELFKKIADWAKGTDSLKDPLERARFLKAVPYFHTPADIQKISTGEGVVKMYHGAPTAYAKRIVEQVKRGLYKSQFWNSADDMLRWVARKYDIPYTVLRNKTGAGHLVDSYSGDKVGRMSTAPAEVASRWATSFPYGEIMSELNNYARLYKESQRLKVDFDDFYQDTFDKQPGPTLGMADRLGLPDLLKDERQGGSLVELEVDARALPEMFKRRATSMLRYAKDRQIDDAHTSITWNTDYKDVKIHPSNVKSARIVEDLSPEAKYQTQYMYGGGPDSQALIEKAKAALAGKRGLNPEKLQYAGMMEGTENKPGLYMFNIADPSRPDHMSTISWPMEPPEISVTRAIEQMPRGDCFANCTRYAMDHEQPGLQVVHGKVRASDGRTIDHAWLEIDDKVIDPTAGIETTKDRYRKLVAAKPTHAYTPEQAAVNMARSRNHGPWTEEEIGNRRLYSGGPDTMEALKKWAPVWKSKLETVIQDKLPGRGKPGQLLETLKNWGSKGIFKNEELKWSGLIPWLEKQTGPVTKDQILNYLRTEGNVQVKVIEKGAAGLQEIADRLSEARRLDNELRDKYFAASEKATEHLRQLFQARGMNENPGHAISGTVSSAAPAREGWLDLLKKYDPSYPWMDVYSAYKEHKDNYQRLTEIENEYDRAEAVSAPIFMQYMQLPPGGRNYREFLFTYPAPDRALKPLMWTESKLGGGFLGTGQGWKVSITNVTPERQAAYPNLAPYKVRVTNPDGDVRTYDTKDSVAALPLDQIKAKLEEVRKDRSRALYEVPGSHKYGDNEADINRISHLFTDDRIIDGKKYLFGWEFQGDWGKKLDAAFAKYKQHNYPNLDEMKPGKERTQLEKQAKEDFIKYNEAEWDRLGELRDREDAALEKREDLKKALDEVEMRGARTAELQTRRYAIMETRDVSPEIRDDPYDIGVPTGKYSLVDKEVGRIVASGDDSQELLKFQPPLYTPEDQALLNQLKSEMNDNVNLLNALGIQIRAIDTTTPALFPFWGKEHEVAFKWMLRKAAEEGYDGIAWASGDIVKERYDLSRHITRLDVERVPNGSLSLSGETIHGEERDFALVPPDKLEEYVPEALANKIRAYYEGQDRPGFKKVWTIYENGKEFSAGYSLESEAERVLADFKRQNPGATEGKVYSIDPDYWEVNTKLEPGTRVTVGSMDAKVADVNADGSIGVVYMTGPAFGDYATVAREDLHTVKAFETNRISFHDQDLKMGGKWAERLYDQTIPWFLKDYGKQWGARPGTTGIPKVEYKPRSEDFYIDERADGVYEVYRAGDDAAWDMPVNTFDNLNAAETYINDIAAQGGRDLYADNIGPGYQIFDRLSGLAAYPDIFQTREAADAFIDRVITEPLTDQAKLEAINEKMAEYIDLSALPRGQGWRVTDRRGTLTEDFADLEDASHYIDELRRPFEDYIQDYDLGRMTPQHEQEILAQFMRERPWMEVSVKDTMLPAHKMDLVETMRKSVLRDSQWRYSGGPDTTEWFSNVWEKIKDTRAAKASSIDFDEMGTTVSKMWGKMFGPPPDWTQYKDLINAYLGERQIAGVENERMRQRINRAVPDRIRQEAITNWIEAGEDTELLKARSRLTKDPELKKGYDAAVNLTEAEKAVGREVVAYYDKMLKEGQEAGLLEHAFENYINHVWQKDNQTARRLMAELNSGMLNTNFSYARKRLWSTYFEGEQLGRMPKDKSVSYLLGNYHQSFYEALAARQAIRSLLEGANKADGLPLVTAVGEGSPVPKRPPEESRAFEDVPPEYDMTGKPEGPNAYLIKPKKLTPEQAANYRYLDHAALRKWKWLGNDWDGKPMLMEGELWVHKDVYPHLKNVLGRSAIRQHPVGRAAMAGVQSLKATLLSLSPFHQVHVASHGIMHMVNIADLPPLDFEKPLQRELVRHGLMVYDHRGLADFAEGVIGTGAGLVPKIPYLGPLVEKYGKYLFGDYIPRLKMKLATEAFERNLKRYADKYDRDQILELSANQANAAFGELNYKAMGRNPTMQDVFRLIALAPDFLEARMRFVGQAFRPGGKEQAYALARGAIGLAAIGMIGSALFGDKKHGPLGGWNWKKPFSFHIGEKEYTIRSVPGDLLHLLDNPRNFVYWRLNPSTVRTGVEMVTGRDIFGRKRSFPQQVGDFFTTHVPIPAQPFAPGLKREMNILEGALRTIGISSHKYRTAAEQMMLDYFSEYRIDRPATSELQALKSARKKVIDYAREGKDDEAVEEIRRISGEYNLAPEKALEWLLEAQSPEAVANFKRLPLEVMARVINAAEPAEEEAFIPLLVDKIENAKPEKLELALPELEKFMDKLERRRRHGGPVVSLPFGLGEIDLGPSPTPPRPADGTRKGFSILGK